MGVSSSGHLQTTSARPVAGSKHRGVVTRCFADLSRLVHAVCIMNVSMDRTLQRLQRWKVRADHVMSLLLQDTCLVGGAGAGAPVLHNSCMAQRQHCSWQHRAHAACCSQLTS